MTSEAYKIAKLNAQSKQIQAILEILRNPVVEILLGYLVIEYAQNKKIIGSVAGTVAEGGILSAVALQQLAPLTPAIVAGTEAGGKIVSGLISGATKALPMLAGG